MKEVFSEIELGDWFGLATIVLAIFVTYLASIFGAKKAGKQKIAEYRVQWIEQFQSNSVEVFTILSEIDRLDRIGRYQIKRRRLSLNLEKKVIELLLMINPDSGTDGSREEYEMETYIVSRLARQGIQINLDDLRKFRSVTKAAWRNAKSEF